jgi:hypothetical protein
MSLNYVMFFFFALAMKSLGVLPVFYPHCLNTLEMTWIFSLDLKLLVLLIRRTRDVRIDIVTGTVSAIINFPQPEKSIQ